MRGTVGGGRRARQEPHGSGPYRLWQSSGSGQEVAGNSRGVAGPTGMAEWLSVNHSSIPSHTTNFALGVQYLKEVPTHK